MIRLPNFTQYYIVSTIFPGMFNALLIKTTCEITNVQIEILNYVPELHHWLLIVSLSIIVTLIVGMFIERPIYNLLCRNNEKYHSYDEFRKWRIKLKNLTANNQMNDEYLIKCTEKLASEFYCFVNILPTVILSSVFILVYGVFVNKSVELGFGIGILIFGILTILLMLSAMKKWMLEYKELH